MFLNRCSWRVCACVMLLLYSVHDLPQVSHPKTKYHHHRHHPQALWLKDIIERTHHPRMTTQQRQCQHLRQTLAGSNQYQSLVTCMDCHRRLLLVHGRVNRTMAARAVAILDPTWSLTLPETPAFSSTTATTTINIQQTVHNPQIVPPTQRTVATQTDPENDP